jgi:WD40 repeat protein
VALKVLPPALAADPVALARFRREIAALARCEHPNLVKILTSGSDGDRHYYAMELVEGTNLADLFAVLASWRKQGGKVLREGHLPAAALTASDLAQKQREMSTKAGADPKMADAEPAEGERPAPPPPPLSGGRDLYRRLAELFADAADALAHLHARGVLHRDLKPGNVMLTADGKRLVIMDLGLAQLKDRSQGLTRTATRWVGTLRYCSPEQLQWNLLDVDERADVYGLGATLFEMLALAPLFDADSEARLIEQVLRREPHDPRKSDPAVPRDLAAISLCCLDKDRSRRYAGASDLAEDLRRFCEGRPVRVRPVTTAQRVWRWCRRNPAIAGMLAAVVLFAATAFAVVTWKWRDAEHARDEERQAKEQAEDARGAEARQARLALSRQLAAQALTELHVNRQQDLALLLAVEAHRAAPTVEARSVWLGALQHDRRLLTFLHGHADGVRATAFSPDGRLLASVGGGVFLWDTSTGRPIDSPLRAVEDATAVAFSPDGKWLAVGDARGQVHLCEGGTGRPLGPPREGHFGRVFCLAFSPDGKTLASGGVEHPDRGDKEERGVILLWNVPTGRRRERLTGHSSGVACLAFSPESNVLVSGSGVDQNVFGDDSLLFWDVSQARPLGPPIVGLPPIECLTFSPDGRTLAAGQNDTLLGSSKHAIRLYDAVTHKARSVGPDLFDEFRKGRGVPDQTQPNLTAHSGRVLQLAYRPDGKAMLSADDEGDIIVWGLDERMHVTERVRSGRRVDCLSFSADRKRWAAGGCAKGGPNGTCLRGDLRLSELDAPPVLARVLSSPRGRIESLALSPDGKWLATGNWVTKTKGEIYLWDVGAWRVQGEPLRGHPNRIIALRFSGDGKLLASGGPGPSDDVGEWDHGEVLLWDVARRERLGEPLIVPRRAVEDLALRPDGQALAASDGQAIYAWDLSTRKGLPAPLEGPEGEVNCLAFSPDGKLLVAGGGVEGRRGDLRLWDGADFRPLAPSLRGHKTPIQSVSFRRDGRSTATAGGLGDGTILLWDVNARRLVGEPFLGRARETDAVALSPEGDLLVSAARSGALVLWDVPSRRPLGLLGAHKGPVGRKLAFSADGKVLLSADHESVYVWELSPEAWEARTRRLVNRNLTPEEWRLYLPDRPYRKTFDDLP